MNIYSFSVFLFSFGVLLIAVLALCKRRDDVSIRFSYFSISVCGWGFVYALWTSQHYSKETTLALVRIFEIFAVFIPITWLHFTLEYIGEKEPFKNFYRINYFLALVLAAFCPTPWFFKGLHEVPVFGYYKTPGPIFYVFLSLFIVLVPYTFSHLFKAYRRATGEVKKQLGFLLTGWFFAFFAGSSTFLPAFGITNFYWLLCLMPVYPFFLGIALIRYGLFDEEHLIAAFQREKLTAIGTMAASLNHELRNPLFIARGTAETFFDQVERGLCTADEKSKKAIDLMYAQLTRASDIMQKFSDFAKPFHKETKKEKVVVREAFENVLQLVSAEFEMNKIQVEVVPTNGLSVYANSRHFEEVLFNLMINACHAIQSRIQDPGVRMQAAGYKTHFPLPAGEGWVRGTAEQGVAIPSSGSSFQNQALLSSPNGLVGDPSSNILGKITLNAYQPNGKVIVEVSDTGPGIPRDQQNKIFQPFYSTKGANGSGLGLYITKQLVERNGGKIKVNSKLGQGTTFRLELAAK